MPADGAWHALLASVLSQPLDMEPLPKQRLRCLDNTLLGAAPDQACHDALCWSACWVYLRRQAAQKPYTEVLGPQASSRPPPQTPLGSHPPPGCAATATALASTLYLLAKANLDSAQRGQPSPQERVLAELRSLQAQPDSGAAPLPLLAAAEGACPYLEACIREALRLMPPAPSMVRYFSEDATIEGIHFPAGSQVRAYPGLIFRVWDRAVGVRLQLQMPGRDWAHGGREPQGPGPCPAPPVCD
jgi:hypothetical protein